MRLKRFFIPSYRVLRDFEIVPSETGFSGIPFNLLIGANGSGKSTLLRLIFETFYRLKLSLGFNYPFQLEYDTECGSSLHHIRIGNISPSGEISNLAFSVDGRAASETQVFQYLPSITAICSAGDFKPWQSIFGGRTNSPGVTCLSPSTLSTVFLSHCLSENHQNLLGFANSPLTAVVGFSIEATGVEAIQALRKSSYFQEFASCSTRTIHQPGQRILLAFDLSAPDSKRHLRCAIGDEWTFLLKTLNLLSHSTKLHVFGQNHNGALIQFSDLGMGERRWLELLAAFSMCNQSNHLLLIDDLDAYLDEVRLRLLISAAERIGVNLSSTAWLVTHSMIPVTDLPSKSTFLLEREGSYTRSARHLPFATLAANWTDIVCYLNKIPHANGEWSSRRVEEAIAQAQDGDSRNLQSLIDLTSGYWNYRMRNVQAALEVV